MKLNYSVSFITFALAGLTFIAGEHSVVQAQQRTTDKDRQALIALEDSWLRGEHDAATLERILAADFVHCVSTGDLLTKTQHIYYSTKYLPPPGLKQRFDNLTVRLYGDVGVVNGIVVTSDEHGKDVDRTIFTDVFAYRDGRWQAINAQENRVAAKPPPK
jgi:hypothetical protein